MKIAFMGIRGIPKGYSGFETFVRELAPRLAARGHDVTVYGRSYHQQSGSYRGVRLVSLPTIRRKHTDTIVHTTLSALHGILRGYDIVYICIVGNAPVAILPRLGGAKVVLNVDAADCEREKWGVFARWYLRCTERIACMVSNVIVADAAVIQARYRQLYRTDTVFIPYGANLERDEGTDELDRFGLTKNGYVLFVGRLVPENAAELLIEAFNRVKTDRKLVILGDAPYSEAYKARLRAIAGPGVVFTGYVFGKGYHQISSHAYCYVLPSGVDGTRPALLDQLGFGNCVLVRGTPANREVVGDHGIAFNAERPSEDLLEKLEYLLDNEQVVERYRKVAAERIRQAYTWESVADKYDNLFSELLQSRRVTVSR